MQGPGNPMGGPDALLNAMVPMAHTRGYVPRNNGSTRPRLDTGRSPIGSATKTATREGSEILSSARSAFASIVSRGESNPNPQIKRTSG